MLLLASEIVNTIKKDFLVLRRIKVTICNFEKTEHVVNYEFLSIILGKSTSRK